MRWRAACAKAPIFAPPSAAVPASRLSFAARALHAGLPAPSSPRQRIRVRLHPDATFSTEDFLDQPVPTDWTRLVLGPAAARVPRSWIARLGAPLAETDETLPGLLSAIRCPWRKAPLLPVAWGAHAGGVLCAVPALPRPRLQDDLFAILPLADRRPVFLIQDSLLHPPLRQVACSVRGGPPLSRRPRPFWSRGSSTATAPDPGRRFGSSARRGPLPTWGRSRRGRRQRRCPERAPWDPLARLLSPQPLGVAGRRRSHRWRRRARPPRARRRRGPWRHRRRRDCRPGLRSPRCARMAPARPGARPPHRQARGPS